MCFIKRMAVLLLAACMLLSFGCTGRKSGEYAVTDRLLTSAEASFGHNRVFYEIFVGSFSDSDGDGVGDLRGIINRMDYLNDGDPQSGRSLGVEGVWLTPIFKSPSYHKYDVTDYYTVDPSFGTEADLKELISLCHERDMLLILDLPINHTGRLNEWFGKFVVAHRQGDTASEFYDFYSWYDSNEGPAPAGRSYTQVTGTEHYVECNFSGDMPELNFDSESVRAHVLEVARHYLELGIDGFRFDAAKYVYLGDNPKSLDFWQWYMAELKKLKPDVYTVAEVWDGEGVTDLYMQAMNCFDFTVSQASGQISQAAQKGNVNQYTSYVQGYIDKVSAMREGASITPFVSNHDMDRAAGYLTAASGYMRMAANLYILGPGTPFIYYGEEIGMKGSRGGASTDANRRLAMLWGDGDTVKDPEGASYTSQIDSTVKEQLSDAESLYSYYKKLILARRANPEIANGSYKALNILGSKAGGFVSTCNGSSVIVLHNTSGSAVTIDLASLGVAASEIRAVIGLGTAELDGAVVKLEAQTSVILK